MATATVEQLPGGRVKIDGAVITLKASDGTLICGNHPGSRFCEHIQSCIQQHADGGMLAREDIEWVDVRVKVPLVPKADQWATVIFGALHEPTMSRRLYLEAPGKNLLLGFLQFGEGRAVIRSMIYDWFRGNVLIEDLKCVASSHSYMQEQVWLKNTDNNATAEMTWAEYWCVYTQKMCLTCYTRVNNIFDDLIPDAGGGKKNWT